MSWDTALRDLSEKVDELERRLEAGAWEDLEHTPFAPPEVEGEMTAEQRARAVALLERVAACRKRLGQGMADTQRELGELDTRRQGARSYARSEAGGQ